MIDCCECCGKPPVATISSSIFPYTGGYCQDCVNNGSEPLWILSLHPSAYVFNKAEIKELALKFRNLRKEVKSE